jgi:hypothetical protein
MYWLFWAVALINTRSTLLGITGRKYRSYIEKRLLNIRTVCKSTQLPGIPIQIWQPVLFTQTFHDRHSGIRNSGPPYPHSPRFSRYLMLLSVSLLYVSIFKVKQQEIVVKYGGQRGCYIGRHVPQIPDEDNQQSQQGQSVSRPRFEPVVSGIQRSWDTAIANTFDIRLTKEVTNCKRQSRYWETNISSAGQVFPCLL